MSLVFGILFENAPVGIDQYTQNDVNSGYGSIIAGPLGHGVGGGIGRDKPVDPTNTKDRVGLFYSRSARPRNMLATGLGALGGAAAGGAVAGLMNGKFTPEQQAAAMAGGTVLGTLPGAVMTIRDARRVAKNLGYGKIGTTIGTIAPSITGLTKPKVQREVERDIRNRSNGKNRSEAEIKKLVREEVKKRLNKIQIPDRID